MSGIRARLPNRRAREGLSIRHRGIDYEVCIGRYVDHRGAGSGRLGELFFNCTKAGTDADADARDMGLMFSLAIQYGAPVETIFDALTRDQCGRPAGLIGRVLEAMLLHGEEL